MDVTWITGATIISALILISLLFVYWRNYKQIKSKFCKGLIIFALLLLLQNVIAIQVHGTMMSKCPTEISGPLFIINFLEAVGLGALLYVTWKPCM